MRAYVQSVISWERQLQLTGLTQSEEAASAARILEANDYAQSRYDECEEEAITACQDAEDPEVLVDFWLWIDAPVDKARAEKLCLGQDYRIDKTVARGEFGISYSIRYTGTKCGGLAGTWEIDSEGTLTGGGDTATIGGPWTVEIPEGSTTGTFRGVANFHDDDGADQVSTQGTFSGTATVTEDPPTLVLEVTSGSGSGYSYGFTDTSATQPGTLTLPLEAGTFCEK